MPGRLGRIAASISEGIESGRPLDDVVDDLGSTLPAAYRHLLTAGLKAGRLPAALEGIARTARRTSELRYSIGLSLIYPIVVLSLVWIMGLLVMVSVAPIMVHMLKEFDVTTAPLEAILERLIRSAPWWGIIVPVLVAGYLAWVWRRSGRAVSGMELHPSLSDRRAANVGPNAAGQPSCAELCDLLALLIAQDVPLPEALELASAAVGSPALAASGKSLAKSLSRGEIIDRFPSGFPPSLAYMLASGQSPSELHKLLVRAAEVYREEVARSGDWLAFYAPLVLTIVVCGGVVFLYAVLTLGPWIAIMRRLTLPYNLVF